MIVSQNELDAVQRMLTTISVERDGLVTKVHLLEFAIRKHRDLRGDDRCWMDDEELYGILPEGYTPPERGVRVELQNCERFIHCRHNPGTEYVSPQRRIEELELENTRLRMLLDMPRGLG